MAPYTQKGKYSGVWLIPVNITFLRKPTNNCGWYNILNGALFGDVLEAQIE